MKIEKHNFVGGKQTVCKEDREHIDGDGRDGEGDSRVWETAMGTTATGKATITTRAGFVAAGTVFVGTELLQQGSWSPGLARCLPSPGAIFFVTVKI